MCVLNGPVILPRDVLPGPIELGVGFRLQLWFGLARKAKVFGWRAANPTCSCLMMRFCVASSSKRHVGAHCKRAKHRRKKPTLYVRVTKLAYSDDKFPKLRDSKFFCLAGPSLMYFSAWIRCRIWALYDPLRYWYISAVSWLRLVSQWFQWSSVLCNDAFRLLALNHVGGWLEVLRFGSGLVQQLACWRPEIDVGSGG